jgi:hypothetical protein
MNTLLIEERPTFGDAAEGRRTEVCDPQISVSEMFGEIFKDLRSKHAVLQLVKLSVIMALTPWLLSYVAAYLEWDGELWAKASLVGVNVVIALYVLLAWQEDKRDREEEAEDKKTR